MISRRKDNESSVHMQPPPTPVYTLRGAGNPITKVHFVESEPGLLVSGCQNGHIQIWDLQSRRIKISFEAHLGKSILFLKADDMGQKLLTHGRDGVLNIWRCSGASYEPEGKIAAEGDGFCAASVLSQQGTNTSLLALPGQDSSILVYSLPEQSVVQSLTISNPNTKHGLCMCISPVPDTSGSATQLLAGYESGNIILWDVRTGKILSEVKVHDDAIMSMSYCSSAKYDFGVSGSVDKTLLAWKIVDSGQIEVFSRVQCTNPGFNCIKFRPDSRIFVTAGWDNSLRIFSAKSLKPLCVLAYHRDRVLSVDFSQQNYFAAGSKDQLISLWDAYKNQ